TAINGTAASVGTPIAVPNGSVTLREDGTMDFAPVADFHGPTSFSYTVSSGGVTETASVNVNVTPLNDTPVPVAPSPSPSGQTFDPESGHYAANTAEDTPFEGRVAAEDVDGDTLTYSLTTAPSHGTVTLDAATGAYTYTPTADYHGTDSFEVTASDGNGGSVSSTVDMTVTSVVDIADDTKTTDEDTPVGIDVLANDSFEGSGRAVTQIDGIDIASGSSVA